MLWNWCNGSVICEYYAAVQTSYWSMADVTFSTVDDMLCINLPHRSLVTTMRRVIAAIPTLQHPSLSLYCQVTSYPDRLIDWMMDWMLCKIHCLCVFVNITKHCMLTYWNVWYILIFLIIIIIIQWLNFSLLQHSLTYSNTTAPVCIVLIVHCVGTIQSYVIYSNDLFSNYHNTLTLPPPPLPSPLFCISVWACVCVCVRCTFRKKTNHNFSLPEIKKGKWKSTQTIFYNNFANTYHDLFFWYATFFFFIYIYIHLYALCWVTRSTYVSEQQMIVS